MIKEWEQENCAFQYEEKPSGIALLQWRGNGMEARLPAQIDGIPLVEIGRKAFLSNKRLQEIYLPKRIEHIGDWAFAYCSTLRLVEMPRREIGFGKGAFLQCERLEEIRLLEEEDGQPERGSSHTDALLAAAVYKLDAPYLLYPLEVGGAEWLKKWDRRLSEILQAPDRDGYSKTILCGEEDLGSMDNNLEFFLHQKRRSKVRLALLRLLHDEGLERELREYLTEYLRAHAKGCAQEETWQVVLEEYGTRREYFDLLLYIGAITEENFDAVLHDMGVELTEMKAYLLRMREERLGKHDFFDSLSLEL